MSQSVVGRGDMANLGFATKKRDNNELFVKKVCNFLKNGPNPPFFQIIPLLGDHKGMEVSDESKCCRKGRLANHSFALKHDFIEWNNMVDAEWWHGSHHITHSVIN